MELLSDQISEPSGSSFSFLVAFEDFSEQICVLMFGASLPCWCQSVSQIAGLQQSASL